MNGTCLIANHRLAKDDDGVDVCITCLTNEMEILRVYVQRGVELLHPFAGNAVIDEYCERAEARLKKTIDT